MPFIPTLYIDDVMSLAEDVPVLRRKEHKLMPRYSVTDRRDVSLVQEMSAQPATAIKGTVNITQEKQTKPLLKRYGMGS